MSLKRNFWKDREVPRSKERIKEKEKEKAQKEAVSSEGVVWPLGQMSPSGVLFFATLPRNHNPGTAGSPSLAREDQGTLTEFDQKWLHGGRGGYPKPALCDDATGRS